MTAADDPILNAARKLLDREANRRAGDPLTSTWTDLTIETAYAIQDAALSLRLDRGERLVGVKLGLTSRAKQERMGVDQPFVAWLTDAMILPLGDRLRASSLIHPRVEPEIAFVLGEDLSGPSTAIHAMRAVESVHSAFEVIDSRFADFRFTAPDVIADNASSAMFTVNPAAFSPAGMDLALQPVVVERNGVVVDSATGAAVLSHPGEALAFAANELARRGRHLEAGHIVLTGGLTDALPIDADSILTFDFGALGALHVWSDAHAAR